MCSLAQSPRFWSRKHTTCDFLDDRGRQSGGENDQNFRNSRKLTEWSQIAPEGSTSIEKHLRVGNVTRNRIYWLNGPHSGPQSIRKRQSRETTLEAPRGEKYGKCSKFSKSRKMVQKHTESIKKHRKGSGSRNQALQQCFAVQLTQLSCFKSEIDSSPT